MFPKSTQHRSNNFQKSCVFLGLGGTRSQASSPRLAGASTRSWPARGWPALAGRVALAEGGRGALDSARGPAFLGLLQPRSICAIRLLICWTSVLGRNRSTFCKQMSILQHFLYLQDLQTFAHGILTFATTPFFRQDFLDVFPGLFPCGIPTFAPLESTAPNSNWKNNVFWRNGSKFFRNSGRFTNSWHKW